MVLCSKEMLGDKVGNLCHKRYVMSLKRVMNFQSMRYRKTFPLRILIDHYDLLSSKDGAQNMLQNKTLATPSFVDYWIGALLG